MVEDNGRSCDRASDGFLGAVIRSTWVLKSCPFPDTFWPEFNLLPAFIISLFYTAALRPEFPTPNIPL